MLRKKILVVLIALLSVAAWAQGQLIWARPDNAPCPATCTGNCNGTFTCPVASVAAGVAALPFGGTLRLFAGTYTINEVVLTQGTFVIEYASPLLFNIHR